MDEKVKRGEEGTFLFVERVCTCVGVGRGLGRSTIEGTG